MQSPAVPTDRLAARSTARRVLVSATTLALTGLLLTACGGSAKKSAAPAAGKDAATAVNITISDQGCTPSPAKVPAGPVKFTVANKNSGKVTEAELLDSGKMLGEKENLTPGLSGDFSLTLDAGKYQVYCPGAGTSHTDFEVTGSTANTWKDNPALVTATTQYASWVDDQTKQLVAATKAFDDAVRAGNADQAKQLYGKARAFYEKIEPTAEIWGDLDGRIDGRIDDAPSPDQFTGYHRLEQALWQQNSLTGTDKLADQLDADVNQLYTQVQTVEYQPAVIANGATDLVNEIETSKVTGEEERYSHTDLIDFQANLDGANEAIGVLMPVLQQKNPQLAASITAAYQKTTAALAPYAAAPGYENTGFVDYSTVTDDQRKVLSTTVNAYAEVVSKVAGVVA
ncbi:cupredoxin domain-containing protein [Kitasatospora sp. NBC_01287]|uniref:iron uptake system protein EfeO n=1 Tax=Kitasatospora sp. NBC_01287 TaxID=2903573 RepID=UPI00225840C6|nr:iron uptake system protein EfeO [Kitasatospora sp. NBC_01287]MCX4744199.1 cupredoxin domain-containing protein [Kitasatospora sp. NBC_01287]